MKLSYKHLTIIILLPTPSRGLSGSLEQNLETLRASPLYEVSGIAIAGIDVTNLRHLWLPFPKSDLILLPEKFEGYPFFL